MVRFFPFAWFAAGVFVPIVEHLLSISDKMWQMMIDEMYNFKYELQPQSPNFKSEKDFDIENAPHQDVDQTWHRLNLWLQHLTVHTKDLWASIFSSMFAMTMVVFVIVLVHVALSNVAHSTNYLWPSLVAACVGIWTTGQFLYGLLPIAQFSDMLVSIDDTVSHHHGQQQFSDMLVSIEDTVLHQHRTKEPALAGSSKRTLHGAVHRNNCVLMTAQEQQGFDGFNRTLTDLEKRKALGVQLPLVGLISKQTIGKLIGLLSGITPVAITSMIGFLN
jgi:hypothetical protein